MTDDDATPTRRRDLGDRPNRCVAKNNKTGERCQNYAIRGGTVCRFHGGATKRVRERAKLRIMEAADPAAAKLVSLMRDRKVPPQVQLAAARDLLDRAGLNSIEQVQVVVKPWQNLMEGGGVAFDLGEVEADVIEEIDDVTPNQIPVEGFGRQKPPRAQVEGRRRPDPLPPNYQPDRAPRRRRAR